MGVSDAVALVTGIVGMVTGCVALWQTRKSNKLAAEANRIAKEANPASVEPFSLAKWVKGSVFSITNLSVRPVVILSMESEDEGPFAMLDDVVFPYRVKYNESVRFLKAFSGNVLIEWVWDAPDLDGEPFHAKRFCEKG